MTQLTEAELERSLEGLAAGMVADGYRVSVRSVDQHVNIVIDASAEACADCLVPKNVMRGIAVSMMNSAGASLSEEDVTITYPEGSAAH